MNITRQITSKPTPPTIPSKSPHLSRFQAQHKAALSTTNEQPSAKRGIGWPWDHKGTLFPLFTASDKITWLFNWELWVPASLPPSIQWIPCVRTAAQCTDITPFLTDISTNQGRTISHFLGFNEPEIPTQANLGVGEAVRLWKEFVLPAKEKFAFKLGGPGVSSDAGKSVPWLDEFFTELGGLKESGVDFLVLHWYGLQFGEMRQHLEMMHNKYGLPVWVNEFACSSMGDGEAGQDQVKSFLREAIPWLEECPWVEKYAYFGNGQGLDVGTWVGRASNFMEAADSCEETEGKQLSEIGKLYLDL